MTRRALSVYLSNTIRFAFSPGVPSPRLSRASPQKRMFQSHTVRHLAAAPDCESRSGDDQRCVRCNRSSNSNTPQAFCSSDLRSVHPQQHARPCDSAGQRSRCCSPPESSPARCTARFLQPNFRTAFCARLRAKCLLQEQQRIATFSCRCKIRQQ